MSRNKQTAPSPVQTSARRRWSVEEKKDFARSIGFLAPSVLGVMTFFIVPFGIVVYYSLINSTGDPSFVFLRNFPIGVKY